MNNPFLRIKGFFSAVGEKYQEMKEFIGEDFSGLKKFPRMFWNGIHNLLDNTKIEIVFFWLLFAIVALIIVGSQELDRGKVIPLAFSEKSQIERDCEKLGIDVPVLTRFHTSSNELYMKIFECWNKSWDMTLFGSNVSAFAAELDRRMDPAMKFHHYEIPQLIKLVPAEANEALNTALKDFVIVLKRTVTIKNALGESWNRHYFDVTHIESYTTTETYTDSDGNTRTETTTHYRTIYDYTIYDYTYFPKWGEESSSLLNKLAADYPTLDLKERLIVAKKTEADNEYAIQKSRDEDLDGKRLGPEELVQFARNWATGSTLMANLPDIRSMHLAIVNSDAPRWRTAKRTAHNDHYIRIDESHSDPGPDEYQVVDIAHGHAREQERLISEVVDGITFVANAAPRQEQLIRELIAVKLDGKKGRSPRAIMRDIMELTKECYFKLFRRGFGIERGRWWLVLIWTILLALVGAGIGWLFDLAGERGIIHGGPSRNNFYR